MFIKCLAIYVHTELKHVAMYMMHKYRNFYEDLQSTWTSYINYYCLFYILLSITCIDLLQTLMSVFTTMVDVSTAVIILLVVFTVPVILDIH